MKNIKTILNIILTFIVLWIAKEYFPEHVQIAGTKELIITVIFMTIADFIFSIISSIVLAIIENSIKKGNGAAFAIMVIPIMMTAFIWIPLKLYLISTYYEGFAIAGSLITYLILSIALSIFSIKIKN